MPDHLIATRYRLFFYTRWI